MLGVATTKTWWDNAVLSRLRDWRGPGALGEQAHFSFTSTLTGNIQRNRKTQKYNSKSDPLGFYLRFSISLRDE